MIVSRNEFPNVVRKLSEPRDYGFDIETKGRGENTRLFSIILSDDNESYYFNFHPYDNQYQDHTLPREWIKRMAPIFENPGSLFDIHNAKFDMTGLYWEGVKIKGSVHCTMAIARVIRNNIFEGEMSLDECVKHDLGLSKSNAVEEYIMKNKLYEKVKIPGKKTADTVKFFDKVPFDIMAPYGEKDGQLHLKLGRWQRNKIKEMNTQGYASLDGIYQQECALTKVLFEMERLGMPIDRQYTERALEYELSAIKDLEIKFKEMTGEEFVDGKTVLLKVLTAAGEQIPKTAKGNPSFNEDSLDGMTTPVAQVIKEIRQRGKRAGTYYSSFLYFADSNDIIHANIKQGGTETGRMSCSKPNLQNLPKEDDPEDFKKPFIIRKCFVPPENACWVMMDYEQQEYRLMLDYAGEMSLITAIRDHGADVHQATAELLKISRGYAKTLNFAILYGSGPEKIAGMLGIKIREARELRDLYFGKLPKVKKFIRAVMDTGKQRGFVVNWAGRRCHISDPEFAYILPNHIIQGGCADVVKKAMIQVHELYQGHQVGLALQVHDELDSIYYESAFDLIPKQKEIMEKIYKPKNGLPLTVSIDHSWKSLGKVDAVKGAPNA